MCSTLTVWHPGIPKDSRRNSKHDPIISNFGTMCMDGFFCAQEPQGGAQSPACYVA